MPQAIRPIHKKPWKPRDDRQIRLASTERLALLIAKEPELYPAHRSESLRIAVWKATELDSKGNPRLRSEGVAKGAIGTLVNHEHG